jgi:hypothetical protein
MSIIQVIPCVINHHQIPLIYNYFHVPQWHIRLGFQLQEKSCEISAML